MPDFAREAVAEQEACVQAWQSSLAGVIEALEAGPKRISEVVEEVAREQAVSPVVVHTALSRRLCRRQVLDVRPNLLAKAI